MSRRNSYLRSALCAACFLTLPACNSNDLKHTLSEIPRDISNDQIADYLLPIATNYRNAQSGDQALTFARWQSPIRVSVINTAGDSWDRLVANWIDRIRSVLKIDIQVESFLSLRANAFVIITFGEMEESMRVLGTIRVDRRGHNVVLRPDWVFDNAVFKRELESGQRFYCGPYVTEGSIEAFGIFVSTGYSGNGPLRPRPADARAINFLNSCFAAAVGNFAPGGYFGGKPIDTFSAEHPLPMLALIYSPRAKPGEPETRASILNLLKSAR